MKIAVEFFLRYAAERVIVEIHTDVLSIVESGEYAHLCKLGHTGKEYEAKIGVGSLEGGKEGLQLLAIVVFEAHRAAVFLIGYARVHHIKQRLVVFVDKYYTRITRLLMRVL